MYPHDLDKRSTQLRTLCTTATNAVCELVRFSKTGILDPEEVDDYAGYFYGAILVACQAYAVGTVTDLNDFRALQGLPKLKKMELYRRNMGGANSNPTLVEFINALANYFKHHEEWDFWPENDTAKTLGHFGIDENTKSPLATGIRILLGDSTDLRGVCEILEDWRFIVFEGYCGQA